MVVQHGFVLSPCMNYLQDPLCTCTCAMQETWGQSNDLNHLVQEPGGGKNGPTSRCRRCPRRGRINLFIFFSDHIAWRQVTTSYVSGDERQSFSQYKRDSKQRGLRSSDRYSLPDSSASGQLYAVASFCPDIDWPLARANHASVAVESHYMIDQGLGWD